MRPVRRKRRGGTGWSLASPPLALIRKPHAARYRIHADNKCTAPRRAARRLYYSRFSLVRFALPLPSTLQYKASTLPSRAVTPFATTIHIGHPLFLSSVHLQYIPSYSHLAHPLPPSSLTVLVRSFSRHPRLALIHSDGSPVNSHRLSHPRCCNSASRSPSLSFALLSPFPFCFAVSFSPFLYFTFRHSSVACSVCSMYIIYTSRAPDHRAVARVLV